LGERTTIFGFILSVFCWRLKMTKMGGGLRGGLSNVWVELSGGSGGVCRISSSLGKFWDSFFEKECEFEKTVWV